MSFTSTVAGQLTRHLPKVASPKTCAVLDYVTAAAFFTAGALFWNQRRRASLAAFINGGAILTLALLTDYPGGAKRAISFRNHGRINAGLTGLTASLPKFMGFDNEKEARFFRYAAIARATTVGLTDYETPELPATEEQVA